MTDYHPLIARAVDGLAKNTGAARRTLYERARAALVAQLRAVEPALSESEITKERLALEEAIRKVEGEAARKALGEPRRESRGTAKLQPRPERSPATKTDSRRLPKLDLSLATEAETQRSLADSGALSLSAAATALRRERSGSAANEKPQPDQINPEQPRLSTERRQLDEDDEAQAEEPRRTTRLSARNRILQARTSSVLRGSVKSFRSMVSDADGLGDATANAAELARETRDSYGTPPRLPALRQQSQRAEDLDEAAARRAQQYRDEDERDAPMDLEPQFQEPEPQFHHEEELADTEADSADKRVLGPSYNLTNEQPSAGPRLGRPQPPANDYEEGEEEEYEEPRPRRSYRGLASIVVLLVLVIGAAAAGWRYRSEVYNFFTHNMQAPPKQAVQTPPAAPKLPGRVPQQSPIPGQPPATTTQPAAQVAQTAALYEADPNDPQGKRYPGSVIWRTETVSPGPGLAPELTVRADISIPERHMTITWSLRRNTDKALPASHTVEIMFNLPPDFPGGGIANVPGIMMKDSEATRGTPLAGLAVKVTKGYFLIGLNAAEADRQRNLELLKDKSWFDILLVYNNGSRAILTMEKGPPGKRAFAAALKAWGE